MGITYLKIWGRITFWKTRKTFPILKASIQPVRRWVEKEPTEYYYMIDVGEESYIIGETNVSPFVAFARLGEVYPS